MTSAFIYKDAILTDINNAIKFIADECGSCAKLEWIRDRIIDGFYDWSHDE